MKYRVDVFKHIAEINIEANSSVEAQEQVKEMLPGDRDFILSTRAVKPALIVLNGKIGVMEDI